MAYNATLAELLRKRIQENFAPDICAEITEKQMFGGLAFLYRQKMAIILGNQDDHTIVFRLGRNNLAKQSEHQALAPFYMNGRLYKDYGELDSKDAKAMESLLHWMELTFAFCKSLA